MFGTPNVPFADILPDDAQHQGDQIRGFGFLHDGSIATVFDFLRARVFTLDDDQRHDLEQFVLAFDTTFAPIVGQQITLTERATPPSTAAHRPDDRARRDRLRCRQPGGEECDLVAGRGRRGARLPARRDADFPERSRRRGAVDRRALRALATVAGQQLTYTCVPPGEGLRLGLDRDGDGVFDRDEIDAGTDPADPASHPGLTTLRQAPARRPLRPV